MIRQRFGLEAYGWSVYAYYAVDGYYTGEIVGMLHGIGCGGDDIAAAEDNISSGKLDTGLTYSNFVTRETVLVIALTSSAEEFAKSWRHEMGHLGTHVAQACGISPYGEEIQYIGDMIVEKTWPVARDFLCECCRKKKPRVSRRAGV